MLRRKMLNKGAISDEEYEYYQKQLQSGLDARTIERNMIIKQLDETITHLKDLRQTNRGV
jgi:flagellar biosynthesis chaperone FliJ